VRNYVAYKKLYNDIHSYCVSCTTNNTKSKKTSTAVRTKTRGLAHDKSINS